MHYLDPYCVQVQVTIFLSSLSNAGTWVCRPLLERNPLSFGEGKEPAQGPHFQSGIQGSPERRGWREELHRRGA